MLPSLRDEETDRRNYEFFTPGYMLASPSGFKNGLCLLHDVGKGEGLAMGYVAYAFQTKVKKTQRNLDA